MSNISIFKQGSSVPSKRGVNELTKALAGNAAGSSKRISIRGGVFRKVVGGEEVGKITGRELNVIVVYALNPVSRIYYAGKYNPTEIVRPSCWANDGMVPDAGVEDKQSSNCATCPQNVAGSGDGPTKKACRYQKRVAVILEGDMSGDVYQLTIPGMSLFGKGEGNTHPFEGYVKYIIGNGHSINNIVTQISMDTDSAVPKLLFTPLRHLDDEEIALAEEAGATLAAKNAVIMTVAQSDGVKKDYLPSPKPQAQAEPDDEIAEPVKRAAKKPETVPAGKKNLADVISAWSQDE